MTTDDGQILKPCPQCGVLDVREDNWDLCHACQVEHEADCDLCADCADPYYPDWSPHE